MAAPAPALDGFENVVRWSLLVATGLAFLSGLVLVIWGAVDGRFVAPIAGLILVALAFVGMGLANSFSLKMGDLLFKARR